KSREDQSSNLATFSKTRVSYSARKRRTGLRALQANNEVQPSGSMLVRFDKAAGHVQSIGGSEATTVLTDGRVVARGETTVSLVLRSQALVDAKEHKILRLTAMALLPTAAPLSFDFAATAREAAIQKAELGNASLDTLLDALADAETKTTEQVNDMGLDLK